MPDTTNLTAGQLSAARRTYTGTAADLEAILEEWDVHIVDEVDDNPERNPHVGFIPAEGTSLVDVLLAWRDAATREMLDALKLRDEYGILDHGGGIRGAADHPKPMADGNMAVALELRAKGIFNPDSRRPASLMRRKATDWEEIPADVTPDDIVPGWTELKAAREAES